MNIGTFCVIAVLALIVALIIRSLVKDKKAGKNVWCGDCDCDCCHNGGACPSSQMALDMAKAMEKEYAARKDKGTGANG